MCRISSVVLRSGLKLMLAEAFKKGVAEPAYASAMDNLGCTAAWEGPAESLSTLDKIEAMTVKVVKKFNLKPE